MSSKARSRALEQQTRTASTFVEIVDILVNDFDVIDVLTQLTARCLDLLHATAAGILLADQNGHLRVVGASSEKIELLELFQLQNEEGPCLDCFTSGHVVAAADLSAPSAWPRFAAQCLAAGFPSVYAIPLHHGSDTLGCLNLFMPSSGLLAASEIALAQALADVASLAIVQGNANRQTGDRVNRLDHALDSRIAIEQAKGMLAEQFMLDPHDAFEILRSRARAIGSSLTVTAHQLVDGSISITELDPRAGGGLDVKTTIEGRRRTVRIVGDLDLASKLACFHACAMGDGDNVIIDLSGVPFMDCSGYGALVAARLALQQRHATQVVQGATGQPAQLLAAIADAESSTAAKGPSSHVQHSSPGRVESPRSAPS